MEFIVLVRQAIEAYKGGDYLCALKYANKALGLALDGIHPDHPLPMGSVPNCADLAACCVELESRLPQESVGVQAVDPSLILTLLPYVLDFLKLLWERRQ